MEARAAELAFQAKESAAQDAAKAVSAANDIISAPGVNRSDMARAVRAIVMHLQFNNWEEDDDDDGDIYVRA